MDSDQAHELQLTEQEKAFLFTHPVIRVGGPKAFPPFHTYDEKGTVQGISPLYVETIAKKLGLKVAYQPASPWPEVLKRAQDKQLDLIGCIAKSNDREVFLAFSSAYLTMPIVIVTREKAPFISGLNDLNGQIIRFTVSLGLAVLQGKTDTLVKVMSRADSALYKAKEEGRNRVVCA